MAAELVVPQDRLDRIGPNTLREHSSRGCRAPSSFQRGNATFILVTFYVLFGDVADDRKPELQEITDWMRDWARRSNRLHHNLLTLGDFFNIDRRGDPLFDGFTSTGWWFPQELIDLPRTIFDDPGESDDD